MEWRAAAPAAAAAAPPRRRTRQIWERNGNVHTNQHGVSVTVPTGPAAEAAAAARAAGVQVRTVNGVPHAEV